MFICGACGCVSALCAGVYLRCVQCVSVVCAGVYMRCVRCVSVWGVCVLRGVDVSDCLTEQRLEAFEQNVSIFLRSTFTLLQVHSKTLSKVGSRK